MAFLSRSGPLQECFASTYSQSLGRLLDGVTNEKQAYLTLYPQRTKLHVSPEVQKSLLTLDAIEVSSLKPSYAFVLQSKQWAQKKAVADAVFQEYERKSMFTTQLLHTHVESMLQEVSRANTALPVEMVQRLRNWKKLNPRDFLATVQTLQSHLPQTARQMKLHEMARLSEEFACQNEFAKKYSLASTQLEKLSWATKGRLASWYARSFSPATRARFAKAMIPLILIALNVVPFVLIGLVSYMVTVYERKKAKSLQAAAAQQKLPPQRPVSPPAPSPAPALQGSSPQTQTS